MDRKHDRDEDDGMQPCCETPRPSKHMRQEQPELADATQIGHDLTPERRKHIYGERLEAGKARILILRAGYSSDEIVCELRQRDLPTQVSLSDPLAYEALSYVWGNLENMGCITLCGIRFPVTRNLAEALRHLRFPDQDRLLWVDAICINQCDNEEKELQLRSMYTIYRFARRVIAWLGLPNNASDQVFSSMNMNQTVLGVPVSSTIMIQVDNEDGAQKNTLKKFMERDYWSRAWIVQEMMAAHSLVLQCGSMIAPYAALEELHPHEASAFASVSRSTVEFGMHQFHSSREQKIVRVNPQHLSCKDYLDCFLDRECGIRHDSIYAFLNLFGDDIQQKIRVRYEDEISELVHTLVRAMIESMQSLYIIVIRGRQKTPHGLGDDWQLDMPSWCPYFATPYKTCPLKTRNEPSLFAEKAKFTFGLGSLRVKGFIIGRVGRTVSRLKHDKTTDWWGQRDLDEESRYFSRCLHLCPVDRRHNPQTILMSIEATTRTLLAGQAEQVSGINMLEDICTGDLEERTKTTLRDMWNIGKSRSVCAFRLGREARRALSLHDTLGARSFDRIALVPDTVRVGDVICTIIGCPTPVVLRRIGTGYHVLGEGYVDTTALGTFKVAVKLRNFRLR
jgi:hypothetical protein